MIILVLAATWVRLWQFPDIPPAFNYDESYNVIDALWLRDTGTFTPFLPGNTGRHALFHYLSIPFLTILGVNTFALRFLSVLSGIIIIPLMYRWVMTMFAGNPARYYLGLIAGTGLAFSFWHITISRSGFRASLLLLLYVLMVYLFWHGWQRQSMWHIAGAGMVLGLGQYTYWSAAILPLQFGLFALIWTIWGLKSRRLGNKEIRRLEGNNRQSPISNFHIYTIKKVWSWIGIMALASLIVFIPLGLFYIDTPLVLQYVSQSSVANRIVNDPQATWAGHLLTSIRIYVDGPVALWQGNLGGRSLSFNWLVLIGFWIGLVVSIKRRYQPAYLFLLTGLVVLWLPAVLNDIDFSDLRVPDMLPVHHAISNLRVAGVLPVYYTIVAVGLFAAVEWLWQRLSVRKPNSQARRGSVTPDRRAQTGLEHKKVSVRKPEFAGLAAFILIFIISGLLNTYNFFIRWPQEPFLYERYNGPIFDLAQYLLHESQSKDILIPFDLYTHPTMHLFFDDIFSESDLPPANSHTEGVLVTASNSPFSAYMWLVRSESGQGTAYLTSPQDMNDLLDASRPGQNYELAAPLFITAQTNSVTDMETLRPALTDWSLPNPVNYAWNNEVRLAGYEIIPGWVQPGQAVTLTLYWENLTDQPLTHDIFIHAMNSQGEGVTQVDNVMLTDGHRWRARKLTPTHHTIQLDDQLNPGPYLIRLGLFNTRTGNRLPVSGNNGQILGNKVVLALFYIDKQGQSPTRPLFYADANLGEQIQVLGYTLPAEQPLEEGETVLSPKIYWQATGPINENYTIFSQLLDSNNQLVAGFDSQPLNGNYPTSLWQPGETVIQDVKLTLPDQLPVGNYRLVTGMYNFQTGQRLTATDSEGQPLSDNMVVLTRLQVSAEKIVIQSP